MKDARNTAPERPDILRNDGNMMFPVKILCISIHVNNKQKTRFDVMFSFFERNPDLKRQDPGKSIKTDGS